MILLRQPFLDTEIEFFTDSAEPQVLHWTAGEGEFKVYGSFNVSIIASQMSTHSLEQIAEHLAPKYLETLMYARDYCAHTIH